MLFEVKVKSLQEMEDGTFKRKSNVYLTDSETFGGAETNAYTYISNVIQPISFQVIGMKRSDIHEIELFDENNDDSVELAYYKNTVEIYGDGNDYPRKTKVVILSQSTSVEHAAEMAKNQAKNIQFGFGFKVLKTIETPIVEIIASPEVGAL